MTDRRTKAEALAEARHEEIDQRAARDQELTDALKLSEPGQEMAQFIQMRHASNTYSSRLGVIAQARDDFEHLTTYLTAEARQQPSPISKRVCDWSHRSNELSSTSTTSIGARRSRSSKSSRPSTSYWRSGCSWWSSRWTRVARAFPAGREAGLDPEPQRW